MDDVELGGLSRTADTAYIDYLKSIEDRWPEYEEFRRNLEEEPQDYGFTSDVYIHDILSDSSRCPPVTISINGDVASIRLLSKALQSYPTGLRSRIVLLELNTWSSIDQRVLNILRLTFNIEPLVFWSLLCRKTSLPRPHGTLNMDYMTLKLIRHFPIASGDIFVAVILVDTWRLRLLLEPSEFVNKRYKNNFVVFRLTLNDPPSANEAERPWSAPMSGARLGLDTLIRILDSLLSARDTTSSEDDMLQCLLTTGKLHLAAFRQVFGNASNLSNVPLDTLSMSDLKEWDKFRYELDHYQDDLKAFSRFVKREFADITCQEQLESTRDLQADLLAEAQNLEARFRDRFQASVGLKSLEESRKSIEEGKSVKMITVLAFVFIPISLASSIFGMNVQEINNTGKHIWTFIVTALVLTSAAFAVWGLSVLVRWVRHNTDIFFEIMLYIRYPIIIEERLGKKVAKEKRRTCQVKNRWWL